MQKKVIFDLAPATERFAVTQKRSQSLRTPEKQPRVIHMRVTAYCPCELCCGQWADGITASGEPITADGGLFVAADPAVLPIGSRVIVPGYGEGRPVRVLDTGGAIKGCRLDVFFASHAAALEWGVQWVDVTVVSQSK